jgi:hypothetical protein
MIRRIARWLLKEELKTQNDVVFKSSLFPAWRRAALLWERYGREMHERHPNDPTFEQFFESLPENERLKPEFFVEKAQRGRMNPPPYR